VLVNPKNPNTEFDIQNVQSVTRPHGLQIMIPNASSEREFRCGLRQSRPTTGQRAYCQILSVPHAASIRALCPRRTNFRRETGS
jgi:hypothetical protein